MSIDYRLVGGSPAPAPYLDMLTAIRWVHAHAEDYRIDPERVYLIGQSAGGQMVSLFATAGEAGFPRVGGWEKARTDVRAVISVAATYELNTVGSSGQPVDAGVRQRRGRATARVTDHCMSAPPRKPLLVHSFATTTSRVPVQQAHDMAAKLKASGVQTPLRALHR